MGKTWAYNSFLKINLKILLSFYCYFKIGSHVSQGWPLTHYVDEHDLVRILLPPPPGAGITGMHYHARFDTGD